MNTSKIEQARDQYLPASLVALRRAAQRAREVARRTGTLLVLVKDGRITREPPSDATKRPD